MNPDSFETALERLDGVEVKRSQTVIAGRTIDFVIGNSIQDYHGEALSTSSIAFTVEPVERGDGTAYQPSPREADEGKYSWTFDEATIHLPTLVGMDSDDAKEFVKGHVTIPDGYQISMETRGMTSTQEPSPHILYIGRRDDGKRALKVIEEACDGLETFRKERGEVV